MDQVREFWSELLVRKWKPGILAICRHLHWHIIIPSLVKSLRRRNIVFRMKYHRQRKSCIGLYQNIIKLQVPSGLRHT